MTKEEFIAKYGDVKVRFSNYYKYEFVFWGTLPNGRLVCSFGGEPDDIYKCEVTTEETTVREIEPNYGKVYSEDGVELESFLESYW